MNNIPLVFIVLFVPIYGISALALWWARYSRHPTLASALRKSAWVLAPLLTVLFAILVLAASTCSGNLLYGFENCRVMPPPMAELSGLAFFGMLVLSLLYTTVLFAIGAMLEWRARR